MGNPISGEYYDLFRIKEILDDILDLLNDADIEYKGLFLNSGSGFDSEKSRDFLSQKRNYLKY
ncbi:hypothetical protein SAMN05880574_13914 [Chryseobacterium sp. RU37D]|uniref:hypothetical protein n=1 Tax=Chryseobacterium sp. RU37D TaxID=1907397 RepID=UPI0009569B2A|nr:hypothetical protein [Chryseobacterium sp. RU37D]SIQ95816.1 hypothetical protein SAMN05880574_13914 [Chryseobacterium sp. RU37D]